VCRRRGGAGAGARGGGAGSRPAAPAVACVAAHPLAVLRLRVLLRQAVGAGETGHLVSLAQTRGDPRVLEATSGRHLWQRYGEGTVASPSDNDGLARGGADDRDKRSRESFAKLCACDLPLV
jgi:hypothetical protein